jgi:hypothetical protein
LLTGGKDGCVKEVDVAGKSCSDCGGSQGDLIRSIDCYNGKTIVGLRNGNIQTTDGKIYMQSHNEGEIWGVAQLGDN